MTKRDPIIARLINRLERAAEHIRDLGCSCVDGGNVQHGRKRTTKCVGDAIAREFESVAARARTDDKRRRAKAASIPSLTLTDLAAINEALSIRIAGDIDADTEREAYAMYTRAERAQVKVQRLIVAQTSKTKDALGISAADRVRLKSAIDLNTGRER